MDLGGKGFLQGFEEGLDEVPLGAPHVDDDCEATFANVLTVGRSEVRHGHLGQRRLLKYPGKKVSGDSLLPDLFGSPPPQLPSFV